MSISVADGSCTFQENAEKQISVEEDTPPGIHIVQYTIYNIQHTTDHVINRCFLTYKI